MNKQERLEAYQQRKKADRVAAGPGAGYYFRAKKHKIPLVLRRFDGIDINGVIVQDWGERFVLRDRRGFTSEIDKNDLQYTCKTSSAAEVKEGILTDASIRMEKLQPIFLRKDRYQIPDSDLPEGRLLQLTLRGGEIVEGRIEWSGKFDIKLELSHTGKSVVVFRHAVYRHKLIE
jgi:hypothetical protein